MSSAPNLHIELVTAPGDRSRAPRALDRLTDALRWPKLGRRGKAFLAVGVVASWLASGIFKVGPDEQGVVLSFGKWVSTEAPGLHFHLPYPMGAVLLPKVTNINEWRSTDGQVPVSRMLTGDENLVEADYTVVWKIKDAGAYLFHVQNPSEMVKMTAETAVRGVIGYTALQSALSDRRQQIATEAQQNLQRLLDEAGAGIEILQVQLQRVDPPVAVVDAFNDVQRARADQVRARNEAEAYRNDVLPRARGQADRIVSEAEAYKTQVVDQAKGEVSAFSAAYLAYREAPQVFAWRTYLDSMDDLLRHAGRVVVNAPSKDEGGVTPFLTIGEMPRELAALAAKRAAGGPPSVTATNNPARTP